MAEQQRSVLEWCGKGFVASVRVSGGRRLTLELPANYVFQGQERRPDGAQVLLFGVPCSSSPPVREGEDAGGREDGDQGGEADEEAPSTTTSSCDSRCLKLRVAKNYRVKIPRSSEGRE